MNNIKIKNLTKQIICIIIVVMFCNFIIPNVVYASDGGSIFDPCMKFITYLCDSIMQFLQNSFTSNECIDNGDGTFDFQYSPAIIFSGTVLGLDINFIKPNTDKRTTNNYEIFIVSQIDEYKSNMKMLKNEDEYNDTVRNITKNHDCKIIDSSEIKNYLIVLGFPANLHYDEKVEVYYYEENNRLYVHYIEKKVIKLNFNAEITGYFYYNQNYNIDDEFIADANSLASYTSIASELQPTIATWYKALRRIALVGLLSVLVYTGIQILITSVAGKENSKYKKMLIDWLIALLLAFTLHYIMSVTIVITQKISSVFNTGDTDPLLNTLRATIRKEDTWGEVIPEVIMYVSLTILTITFTFQYLKRVVYMAFFTLMAPLVTLTYPLDKIKDGKAQAFTMWLREYIFNALIQVVHLIVYYVLVGSALALVDDFPLYAVIAIGFIVPGEKIIRNMFGFNNAETIGTLGAMAAGGLASTAMNKIKNLPKLGKTEKTDSSSGGANKSVRTSSNNPISAIQGGSGSGIVPGNSGTTGTNAVASGTKPRMHPIKGAMSVAGRYHRQVGGAVLGGMLGASGAMLGFASGVAQGDLGSAFKGAVAGGTAGYCLGKAGVNLASNTASGIKNTAKDVIDTWNEGTNNN